MKKARKLKKDSYFGIRFDFPAPSTHPVEGFEEYKEEETCCGKI